MTGTSYTLANQTSAPDELASALKALERGGAITPISLDLHDPTISYTTWLALGEAVSSVRKASSWWLGDWYIFGGVAYGEDKAAAAEAIAGVSAHTLSTIVRTCMYVPKSRRRLNLPFSHHTEVARLMPEEQSKWLRLAEEGDWSRELLREQIARAARRFPDVVPKWEGAIIMRRQLDVEKLAREIWHNAVPEDNHYKVGRELMDQLGEALGEKEATPA